MQKIAAVTLDTNRVVTHEWIDTRIPDWCDLHVHVIDAPIDKGFAAARNYAFAIAALSGADWGLMLDTDMHYEPLLDTENPIKEQHSVEVIAMSERSGSYTNDRLFRLPLKGQFFGATHEYYDIETPHRSYYNQCRFWEDDKSPDQLQAKAKRDIQLLNAELVKNRSNGRNLYYRADSYTILGEWDKALASFNLCAAMTAWSQEAAWSMYRCGEILYNLKRYREARVYCISALKHEPAHPESAWLAGRCGYELGEYENAVVWANIAIAMTRSSIGKLKRERSGFSNKFAWYEGPYDVLMWSYKKLGMSNESGLNKELKRQAEIARLRYWS